MTIKRPVSIAMAVVPIVCLLLYLPALQCGFVTLDDPDYVLNNLLIRRLDRDMLVASFSQAHIGWWMPLTWISLAIDYHFWGIEPFGYHLTNIVLHAVNAGVVVLIADRLLRGTVAKEEPGWHYPAMLILAGLLFGMHPLRVESVAWVTERKDVLNGLFSFGAILCYLRYAERKESGSDGAGVAYCAALALFALSLMAKSASVVLPAMLLVLDWYPLARGRQGAWGRLVVEKLPFFALAAAMSAITIYFTRESQYLVSLDQFPLWDRFIVSGNAIIAYIRYLIVPVGILPFYMIPDPIPVGYIITSVVAVMLCVMLLWGGRRHPAVAATWLLFLLPLLPVLAFFQNGDQSYAARFTYLPSVVPSVMAASVIAGGYRKAAAGGMVRGRMIAAAAILLAVFYAGMTVRLISVWKDPESIWTRVIEVAPEVISYKERGKLYYVGGRYTEAAADFTAAIKIATGTFQSSIFNLYAFRGEAYRSAGRFDAAVQDFSTAISLFPHPSYYYHRALSLKALGRMKEAEEDLTRAGAENGPLGWYEKGEG
ncbi:transmembrane and TPR repeat-containing protein [Geobacter sp. OR-1]|uniref:tetratricopeptide repeat protein n=1 Tax=Geobacter sp. OR-1 TaxID=1266765 RepID=UPI000541C7A0|nr:tetratricopeptide repeat protein [Geobacter sp. OR-1]GAM10547.1 transmembrane and TPR repeat-containing protein [Geobacter sp. OR-1]